MGLRISLCLLLFLAACAAPLQAAPELSVPEGAPLEPSAPEGKQSVPGSSVILTMWDAEKPEIHLIDPATGGDVPGYAAIHALPQVFSPDGRLLAAVESNGDSCEAFAGGTSCRGNAAVLHLIDLQSWQDVTATISTKGWAWPLAFSPDASRLALAYHEDARDELLVFDTESGELAARGELPYSPSQLGYTADGSQVLVYGQAYGDEPGISEPEPPRVLLLDAASLNVQWDQELNWVPSGFWCQANCEASHELREMISLDPAVVLSQAGGKLYVVHAEEDLLTTVDLDTRSVINQRIQEQGSWLERILAWTAGTALAKGELSGTLKRAALSPDGQKLFIVEQQMGGAMSGESKAGPSKASPGLKVVDVETGALLASRDLPGSRILVSPDGAYVFVEAGTQGQLQTHILDAASLASLAQLEGWEVRLTSQVDGQPVLGASWNTSSSTQLGVLDLKTFEVTHPWTVDHYASWQDAQ